ncbi:flagellar motor stator protein MotA [Helicobacter felis]|uniref:flagellar motor stator protein MotA n=1 Tax=Helicobacter felis TaxID=214 RepID=UPI0001EFA4A9|nr:flagellar motor stator protein MotA [Helicobacter felis]CBY83208.1 putative flagellar motor proton channel MotA (pseudogene) [Helicobacter felis ATCC 49179]
MDLSSVLGVVFAILAISVGDIMEGGNPAHVVHLSSLIIIIPTTLCAAMVSTHARHVKAAYKEIKIVFLNPKINLQETIKTIVELSTQARKDGVLSLESKVAQIEDDFTRNGFSMIVDGKDIKSVQDSLEVAIEELEEHYHGAAHYWITAGESAPTFGLVGAVLGLMLALQKLDNPQEMALGIAGAFTATVTGIMCSYALFGPFGNKLKNKSKDILKEKILILEGVIGIANGDNPRDLEMKLLNYIAPGEPKKSQFE